MIVCSAAKVGCRQEEHEVSAGLCYAVVDVTHIPF
jgi:hypothetical protein